MPVEEYASIQAEIWVEKSETGVLSRHGLTNAQWALQQSLMNEAVDNDEGDLGSRLTSAIAAAMRKVGSSR